MLDAIFTRILGMLPRFSANQNFWGALASPSLTKSSELFSIIFVILFEVNIVDEQTQT